MNTRGLLDQLLRSGQQMLQDKVSGKSGKPGKQASNPLSGGLGGGLGGLLSGAGGGALAAGAMSLLKGKKSRGMGGKVLTYGGLAALGVIAYKAYNNWQASQGQVGQREPQTIDRLPADQAEEHSQAILRALVAAAKADGHVDERERELIEGEFVKINDDRQFRQWLHAELDKPLDPAEVARAARTPEIAAEMYIASLILVDEEHFMERAYLDELARQLNLAPTLKAELEAQVRQA